jgi:type IV secretory pathway VirB10-like protein
LYEGEMLEAVLVNRIIADTEPSPVVCHLAKDVFDRGARYVVLPASSRIVGVSQVVNYKGAHRLFISFHRIILPNGPSVDLPSSQRALKALDETGSLGVVSKVERHWFLQFGTAIFFGVLDGLAGAAQRNRDVYSTRSVILGRGSENFDRILENIMAQYSTIVPTIRVDQGKTMKIYLSDDVLISPYAKISDRSYYAHR